MNRWNNFIPLFLIAIVFTGCNVYSFTGASISPEVKTVAIQYFPNNAPIVNPNLSSAFTEKLKDKFVSQTNLNLVDSPGDLNFSGAITGYSTQPIAIQENETAALNRLTITINVKFVNLKDPRQDFESNFSRYSDYNAQESLTSVEDELVNLINEQLVDDIFNRAVINW
ncbi:MAG: LptE family protein [Bacteroidia bacterium]